MCIDRLLRNFPVTAPRSPAQHSLIALIAGLLLTLWLLLGAAAVSAQQVQLLGDGALIIGVVSNDQGAPAADITVQIAESDRPRTPITTLQTDAVGIFTYTGIPGTGYLISAGSAQATITLAEAPPVPLRWPPIYITLGALLLLSLIPARLLRRKELS